MYSIIEKLNLLFMPINTSPFFSGIMMILLNVYSKYITLEISSFQDSFLKRKFIRRIMIFVMAFMATKDVLKSLVITAVFIIFAFELFNENSSLSLLPKELRKYDTNNDNKLSPSEIKSMYEKLKHEGKLWKI